MSNVLIRPATAADLPQITALVQAAYTPWVAVIGATPGPMQDAYGPAIAEGVVQVMEDAQGLVAMLILRPLDDAMLLENVAVLPRAQGMGLGQSLLSLAERATREAGLGRIVLYTHARMASNLALYERAGFVRVEERRERGLDRVYMEKTLS